MLSELDAELTKALDTEIISDLVDVIPESWLTGAVAPAAELRNAYTRHLTARLVPPRPLVEESIRAR